MSQLSLKEREKGLKRADKLRDQAITRAGMGKYDEAEDMYQKSMALRCELLGPDDPQVAALYTDIADMWMSQHEFAKAEPNYDNAKIIVEKAIARNADEKMLENLQQQHRRALRDLAFLYYLQGSVERRHSEAQSEKWKVAEEFFQNAIQMTEEQLGRRTPELVEPLRNLASLYVKMGNFQKGELNFRRCIGIQLHNFGMDSPCVLQTRQQLAIVHERRDQRQRHEAATVVQAGWRGHKGRLKARQTKERKEVEGTHADAFNTDALSPGPASAVSPTTATGFFASGCDTFGDYDGGGGITIPISPMLPPALVGTVSSMPNTAVNTALSGADPLSPGVTSATSGITSGLASGIGTSGRQRRERDRALQKLTSQLAAKKVAEGQKPTSPMLQPIGSGLAPRVTSGLSNSADLQRGHLSVDMAHGGLASAQVPGAHAQRTRPWLIRQGETEAGATAVMSQAEQELLGYLPPSERKKSGEMDQSRKSSSTPQP